MNTKKVQKKSSTHPKKMEPATTLKEEPGAVPASAPKQRIKSKTSMPEHALVPKKRIIRKTSLAEQAASIDEVVAYHAENAEGAPMIQENQSSVKVLRERATSKA